MGLYDYEKTAREYFAMAEGDEGMEIIQALRLHVPYGASVLNTQVQAA